jgi:hypothetical protein
MKRHSRIAIAVLAALAASDVRAANRYVAHSRQTPDPGKAYTSWSNAASNIQDAVNAAAINDTVWVGPGRYTAPPNATNYMGTNVVYINKPLTLRSSNGVPETAIIDGQGVNRGITWYYALTSANPFVLNGLTVSNCFATNMGGGILFVPGSVSWIATVQRCVISHNTVRATGAATIPAGGGIHGGNVVNFGATISNCVFRGNLVTNTANGVLGTGGGLNLYGMANRLITGCLFEGNSAGQGGGGNTVYNATKVENCVMRHNTARNSASTAGGGGFMGSAIFKNCLIHNNRSAGNGGGVVAADSGPITFYNCSIVSNRASNGGGIRTRRVGDRLAMYNSIVCFNTGGASRDIVSGPATNSYTNCCISYTNATLGINVHSGIITNNPQFVDLAGEDFHLRRTSPCINKGLTLGWESGALDLDGRPRLDRATGIVDMGCYEFETHGTVITVR